jgi:plasmid maintenance system antidote protein VapI
LRFAAFFGTTPEFWMSLQDRFDLIAARSSLGAKLKKIQRLRAA